MRKINNAYIHKIANESRKSSTSKYFQQLTPALTNIYQEVQRELALFEGQNNLKHSMTNQELMHLVILTSDKLGLEINTYERDQILGLLEKDQKPFSILQSLVDDPKISDIIISNYSKISIQQGRSNYNTDLSFPSQEIYESFVERLLNRAGSTYSTKVPIADGMIGSYARLHVVHKSLAQDGPYLTIRINRFSKVQLLDLYNFGLAPKAILDYLRIVAISGKTILIVGEVGTGKTTLARAIASALPLDESLLVIEDTPEIKLVHPHVRTISTREDNVDGSGKVSPSQCIRAGMRMAMNRIIFGEMRDSEAAEAFIDVCASGHPGLSTIHAKSAQDAIARLELFLGRAQKGVSQNVLKQQIATAVQVVVHVDICKITRKRRIIEIRELGDVADGSLRQREIFKYKAKDNNATWRVINKVSNYREELEGSNDKVILSALPDILELDFDIAYKEVTNV